MSPSALAGATMPLFGGGLPLFAAINLSKFSLKATLNLFAVPSSKLSPCAECADFTASTGSLRSVAKLFVMSINLLLSMNCLIPIIGIARHVPILKT